MSQDCHLAEPGTEIDELVLGSSRNALDHREDLVHATREIGDRSRWKVGDIWRQPLETEELVGPGVAISKRHREKELGELLAAERAGLDPSASRLGMKPERAVHRV